jgi:hypothetical protein
MEQHRKGEKEFLRKFETLQKEKPEIIVPLETKEKVKNTLEKIKKEIEELPEIRREKEFHEQMPANQITNILAQAIQIALDESLEEGFKFIYQTNNPYLIDAFHDILIGHFVHLLMKK